MKRRALQNTIGADEIVAAMILLSHDEDVFVLDSCGARHGGARRLICGIRPLETHYITDSDPNRTLETLDRFCAEFPFVLFTVSYDFGLKLNRIESRHAPAAEPDVYLAVFDCLLIFDYETGETLLIGDQSRFDETEKLINGTRAPLGGSPVEQTASIRFETTRSEYLAQINAIAEQIRSGLTYQTNLTQQIAADLSPEFSATSVFERLRAENPAPFAAFVRRPDSTVISASPERFFSVGGDLITASPIKGTRPSGETPAKDLELQRELEASAKDRAENVMIVDLLRNDLGRVCEFGSVAVDSLCVVERHPTIFHLVSTISGRLRSGWRISDLLVSLFPCGSITGAPKISTMRIIDAIESSPRGLSMGAIGYFANQGFGDGSGPKADISVAIRTMVFRGNSAVFNVGGGIVIDSLPEDEYAESMLKAKALLRALGVPA